MPRSAQKPTGLANSTGMAGQARRRAPVGMASCCREVSKAEVDETRAKGMRERREAAFQREK